MRAWVKAGGAGVVVLLFALFVFQAGASAQGGTGRSWAGTIPAPDFPPGLEWINVERPLAMADLAGKAVLLDFWTYGCINCLHNLPGLLRLQEEFRDELVIIGVHSAKFPNEGETGNIRQVALRYGLDYPIVNDRDFILFRMWGARAWPTLVLIDPAGKVVGGHAGEGAYPVFQPVLKELIAEFDALGLVDREPPRWQRSPQGMPPRELAFPGKVLADPGRGRVFIADTHNHRIVVASLESGQILRVIGSGEPGLVDGGEATASFTRPQGMALSPDGLTLYVADSGNHAIRRVDLAEGQVSTLVGTGEQAKRYPPRGGRAPDVELSSPWDLALVGDRLFIAMAGSHQLWVMDLGDGMVEPWAGNGLEGTVDGPVLQAELAQPMGLTYDPATGRLYFVDTEASSVRWADTGGPAPVVGTLAGSGRSLFDFGDQDGVGREARFQHPRGISFYGGKLYVADTYNGKIKEVDPATGRVQTRFGAEQGWRDGVRPLFYEPGGLHAVDGKLYVADTNNNVVRVVDLATGEASSLVLWGGGLHAGDRPGGRGRTVRLDPVQVAAGRGAIHFSVAFPEGYTLNSLAPSTLSWRTQGGSLVVPAPVEGTGDVRAAGDRVLTIHGLPARWEVDFLPGSGLFIADFDILYCEEGKQGLCFIEQVAWEVPLVVGEAGEAAVRLAHTVELPGDTAPGGPAIPRL